MEAPAWARRPFSSLIIGIWAAAAIPTNRPGWTSRFQFPHHRDLGCSGVLYTPPPAPAATFQFPHHRDLGCSIAVQARAPILLCFQFPHHRDLGCSVPENFVEVWAQCPFQFPHHRDLGCSVARCGRVGGRNAWLSVPSS